MKWKKERKKTNLLLGAVFIPVLALIVAANFAVKDKEVSETENRTLSQRPVFTLHGVADGTYMDQFESYASDQFIGWDAWRKVYTVFCRIGGSREEEGVFLGKNNQLMEDISVPDEETLDATISGLNRYAEDNEDVRVSMLLVPDAAQILQDELPIFAQTADQSALFGEVENELSDRIQWIDGISVMENHSGEKLYYKTDHHWTTQGAYDMFLDTAAMFDIEDAASVSYDVYTVTDTFNGTLSGTSGFDTDISETIEVYIPQEDFPYVVTYVEEQTKSASLYNTEALDTKDQYAVFLNGNHSLIEIETAAENDRVLLLVKDSFANSMVSFFIPYYREIVIVDPRYYAGYLDDLTETYHVTDTLFLYSGNTFFTDTNLQGILGDGEL